jgi:hypothetical protein
MNKMNWHRTFVLQGEGDPGDALEEVHYQPKGRGTTEAAVGDEKE